MVSWKTRHAQRLCSGNSPWGHGSCWGGLFVDISFAAKKDTYGIRWWLYIHIHLCMLSFHEFVCINYGIGGADYAPISWKKRNFLLLTRCWGNSPPFWNIYAHQNGVIFPQLSMWIGTSMISCRGLPWMTLKPHSQWPMSHSIHSLYI